VVVRGASQWPTYASVGTVRARCGISSARLTSLGWWACETTVAGGAAGVVCTHLNRQLMQSVDVNNNRLSSPLFHDIIGRIQFVLDYKRASLPHFPFRKASTVLFGVVDQTFLPNFIAES